MNIDLLNPASFAQGHPLEQYRWLRDNDPVYWHEEPNGPGFWALTRFEDVAEVGREPFTYSSEPTIMIPDPETGMELSTGDHKMMLMMDPPQHTLFRKTISREFTRGPAAELRPRISELAAAIVNKVIDAGECDFVEQVAGELPSYVIAELMGIPLEDGRELYKLTETIHSAPEAVPEGAQTEAVMKMFAYAQEVYREKRNTPTDDLASQIVHAQVEGRSLDEVDFQLFFTLLIDAGGDTTRNLVAGGLYELIRNPQGLRDWQEHRSSELDSSAREELLRIVSPVIYMRRTLTKDVELHGKLLKAGDKVVRYFGAANFDDRKFTQPTHLDLNRYPNEQISFGTGTHVCLGQHIARVEIDCIFHEILDRMTDFRLPEEPVWLESNFISGIKKMPLEFQKVSILT
ncbi:MAG: cytochrome P450 [Pseudomonadales bacterium]|nr:cytochrome P450 [Pseudomonadales bacterium]